MPRSTKYYDRYGLLIKRKDFHTRSFYHTYRLTPEFMAEFHDKIFWHFAYQQRIDTSDLVRMYELMDDSSFLNLWKKVMGNLETSEDENVLFNLSIFSDEVRKKILGNNYLIGGRSSAKAVCIYISDIQESNFRSYRYISANNFRSLNEEGWIDQLMPKNQEFIRKHLLGL